MSLTKKYFFKKIVFSIVLQCLFGKGSVIDMRLHRFYVSQPLGEEVVIADVSLVKQWSKVFRYKKGDFVVLFNGDGHDVTYCIDTLSANSSVLVKTKSSPSYIPHKKLTLYLSVIKKDNFELVVQKATELGVTSIVPIISERSEKKNLSDERLNKIALEASEQCGRGDIPTISPIITLFEALKNIDSNNVTFVLQMGGVSLHAARTQQRNTEMSPISLFIGPEGGWSEKEENLFKERGLVSVSLGATVLRAETAAIVGCAYMLQDGN